MAFAHQSLSHGTSLLLKNHGDDPIAIMLSQMLPTNQWLDKLMALHVDLVQHGILEPSHAPPPDSFDTGMEDEGVVNEEHVIVEVLLAKTPGTKLCCSILLCS